MEELQIYLGRYRVRQHDFYFLYPLLLQEFIYTFINDGGFTRSLMFNVGSENHQFSFLIVKRLMIRIYQLNYLIIISTNNSNQNPFFGHKQNVYFQMISSEVVSVIVKISFFLFFLASSLETNKLIKKYKNLRSIHSILTFLEEKLSRQYYVSNIFIPYPVHLEILIQIIRYWIKDAFFLHFLRFFLFHENSNWNSFLSPKRLILIFLKKNQRLLLFLYNSYIYEYESIFVFIRHQFFHLQSTFFVTFLDRIYLYEKIEHIMAIFSFFQTILWLFRDPFIHYVRYQGKSIMVSKSKPFIMNKWKYSFSLFCEYHFYVWSSPTIHIISISKTSLDFLGYFSSVQLNPSVVRSQMFENSYIIDNYITNKLDTTISILSMIRSLSKDKFCNLLGHPISKLVWADLTDSDIFYLFWCIYRNLSYYHNGSSKKSIFRIKYILQLSCVRTIVHKHKTTVRAFLKNIFGSEFLEELFTITENKQVIFFMISRSFRSRRFYRGRIWYLNLFHNDLVHKFIH